MTEASPTPEPATAPQPEPQPEPVLSRSDSGRMFTGVCAGLGRYTGIDPVLFRVGFAVLVLASGTGVLLYGAAFLLMRRPGGGPGFVEQWSGRTFDAETVLALLAAVFAFGLIINVGSGIGRGTIVVATLLAIVLLAAHARGVDLLTMARSMPERAAGRRSVREADPAAFTETFTRPPQAPETMAYGTPPSADAPAADEPCGQDKTMSYTSLNPNAPGAEPSGPTGPQGPQIPRTPEQKPQQDPRQDPRQDVQDRNAQSAAAPGPVPPPPAEAGYRRLSDLAREARAGARGYAAGEPFAPHGPYTKRPPSPSVPYAPPVTYPTVTYPPEARPSSARRRPKSFIGRLTLVLALIVGGIMVTLQRTGATTGGLPLIGGAVLVTIGAGLLVAAWYGRGAGLVATGIIVSLVVIAGSTMNGITNQVGSFSWHPAGIAQATTDYTLGVGEGRLDLTEVVLSSGRRVTYNASVSIGQIMVIVPRTARVEVNASTRLGEVRVDNKVDDGADVRLTRVLEPEPQSGTADAPTIELNVKAGFGDVEVHRAA